MSVRQYCRGHEVYCDNEKENGYILMIILLQWLKDLVKDVKWKQQKKGMITV